MDEAICVRFIYLSTLLDMQSASCPFTIRLCLHLRFIYSLFILLSNQPALCPFIIQPQLSASTSGIDWSNLKQYAVCLFTFTVASSRRHGHSPFNDAHVCNSCSSIQDSLLTIYSLSTIVGKQSA